MHKKENFEKIRFQVPTAPGNYPEDLITRLEKVISSSADQAPDIDKLQAIHTPKHMNGTVILADIRNFTWSVENNDITEIQNFLNQFFTSAVNHIKKVDERNAFVNKLLGDGLFAHVSNEVPHFRVLDAARAMLLDFNKLKLQQHLMLVNLSIAITRADYWVTSIGGSGYTDYTLVGAHINGLFRMLSCTDGGLIFFPREMLQFVNQTHHSVYYGQKAFKGIIPEVPCYSIIRKKTKNEKENHCIEKCDRNCKNFNICYTAWESGKKDHNENTCSLDLDCNACGPDRNRCHHWGECRSKWKSVSKGNPSPCCHICCNFRNCFHNYQLGKQGQEMVRCDDILQQSFEIGINR